MSAPTPPPCTPPMRGGTGHVVLLVALLATSIGISQAIAQRSGSKRQRETNPRRLRVADAYAAMRPMAWWRLREAGKDGAPAWDVMSRHDGKFVIVHEAFDGVGSHVNLGTVDIDAPKMSILAFFRANSFEHNDARIISKAQGTAVGDHYWMLSSIGVGREHRLRFRLRTGTKTHELIADSGALRVSHWHMAAATYDGRQLRLYLDGQLVGQKSAKGRVATNSHCEAWIGDNPSGKGSRPFDGQIEDVALFDRAIDGADISAMASLRIAPDSAGKPSDTPRHKRKRRKKDATDKKGSNTSPKKGTSGKTVPTADPEPAPSPIKPPVPTKPPASVSPTPQSTPVLPPPSIVQPKDAPAQDTAPLIQGPRGIPCCQDPRDARPYISPVRPSGRAMVSPTHSRNQGHSARRGGYHP